jgi:hypothetical protein
MGVCMTSGTKAGAACQSTRKTMANCEANLGLTCIVPAGATMNVGTCVADTLAAPGAPCGSLGTPVTSVAVCQAGGLCKRAAPTDPSGTCVAPAADGAACDSDAANGPPCLAPAKCVPPSGSSGTAGTCVVPNASTCM